MMDLMYAVTHDDKFDNVMMSSDVLQVLEIAMLKLGLSSLGAPVRLELSNGEALCISVEGKTPAPMKFSVQELRPEVLAFALMMEQRLREKDAEWGDAYKTLTHAQLGIPALAKCMQLSQSIGKPGEVKKHSVDVANNMMMIAFVEGVLPTDEDGGPGWAGVDQVNPEPLEIPAFLRLDRIDPHN
jgi:hypothetical protein